MVATSNWKMSNSKGCLLSFYQPNQRVTKGILSSIGVIGFELAMVLFTHAEKTFSIRHKVFHIDN